MSTVRDLIKGSLRLVGVVASGETPSSDEQADALVSLNDMLEEWSTEGLLIYETKRESFPLVPGKQTYTIGSSGDLNTARPMRLVDAATEQSGLETPLEILLTPEEWAEIQNKTITGTMATRIYMEPTAPLAKLMLWPIPTNADNLIIYTEKALPAYASVNDSVVFPPGYAKAIRYNLALEMAPEFGKEPSALVVQAAIESKAKLMRLNSKPVYIVSDPTGAGNGRRFNILTGE